MINLMNSSALYAASLSFTGDSFGFKLRDLNSKPLEFPTQEAK